MGPRRRKLPFSQWALLALLLLVAGCLGNDFRNSPLSVEKWDHGWLIAVEPEERFSIDLPGNYLYPDSDWAVTEFDTAVLQFESEGHEDIRPPSGDPSGSEPEDYDPGSPVPRSWFDFTGVYIGETVLRFELVTDGKVIDIAEYTVLVVEDACAAATAAVANRCGGDGFTYQPQMLHERSFGEEMPLQVGEATELVLHSNALHPEAGWEIVSYDESVISVVGPVALGPAREPGDFSEVDIDTSHSFLAAWEFTITGRAVGETTLILEIEVDGGQLDAYSLDFVVDPET